MATKRILLGGQLLAVDEDTGALVVLVSGLTFDRDIDIGDLHLLNIAGAKINPATCEGQTAILAKLSPDPATQTTLAAVLAKLAASVAVTGPLTNTELRATAVPVSGTVAVTGVASETTLAAVLAAAAAKLLSAPAVVTITTGSQTLADLMTAAGASVGASLKRLTLKPQDPGIYWNSGAAATTSTATLNEAVEMGCDKAAADALQFIVASGTVKLEIVQEG